MKNPNVAMLAAMLEESFQKKAWHGPNLRGSIRGLTAEEAAWRPAPERHNIWEIVVHCAYWKYTIRRRLLGEKRGSFPLNGSNWFKRPLEMTARAWKHDIELLNREHEALMRAVMSLRDRDLDHISRGSRYSNQFIMTGIASHDVYHAGQIQLLKRLQK